MLEDKEKFYRRFNTIISFNTIEMVTNQEILTYNRII